MNVRPTTITSAQPKWPVAIIGSGNIATDLMLKILRSDGPLSMGAMVGIDPESDGLCHALQRGVPITSNGIDDLLAMSNYGGIKLIFDATSAAEHQRNWTKIKPTGLPVLDLTPSRLGSLCVPPVNTAACLDSQNINMVTCGGQATVPIVSAISRCASVFYAEVVSAISSKSAGPNTRANIDEFIETTSTALETIGGAEQGRTIMILNPADPPILMRNTVHCLVDGGADRASIIEAVKSMVASVRAYVPGYQLKQEIQFDDITIDHPIRAGGSCSFAGVKVTVLLEVAGAGDYLPTYAGNFDIMTSTAKALAEQIAART